MNISLDNSDIKILNLIQKDATLTNQDIAEQTGVSATSVWRRIKNLEDVGVIKGTVALLDHKKTKLNVCVIIHVRLSRHGEETRIDFEDFIASRPEVVECYAILGNHDYSLTVMVPDVEMFEKFLAGHLLNHPLISESTSFFTLRQVKYSTALPLNLHQT
ncbi:MAG: Lrp/AsnC family transcriptional regulator [Kordiimonadaceae bacterium]|jgi:Lrp/AsnC family transcriptional regulator, leucine-responsive regulatory protein|nr:Lrp/AsnC family transcriptional regulator [Kordiimonadaceae bacterium]MBT6033613.1 Lrp/AsnC family transcriptional regulator [Kordiimonadaceae bacterium]